MTRFTLSDSCGRRKALVLCASVVVAALAGALAPAPARATMQTRNPEDLLIVDCLLPGTMRKLGKSTTFMGARRPVRTTQADCEIRGGEYVAYDRANYQTALKVWMGQAELGDVEAQNYVGEIYLKGLGTDPDYAKSAEWFGKAATQGSRRARINLGYQYEQGLGVQKDLARALNLYREASGIDNDKLVFASAVTAQVQEAKAESAALRQQLSGEQEKSAQLRAQVDQLKSELQQRQQNYKKSQTELDDVRHKLDTEQAKAGIEHDPQFAKLQAQNQARERELSEQQHKLQSEQAAVQGDHERVQRIEQQLAENEQQRQQAQAAFDQARAELAREHAQNDDAKKLLKLMEAQLSEKRQQLASQRNQMSALQAQIDQNKSGNATSGFTTASTNGALRLEILQPALAMTRGLTKPAASVPSAQDGVDIVGRVLAPSGLTSLNLNGQTLAADAGGMFKTHVALAGDNTNVHLAALDKSGGEAMLDFVLVPGPGGKAVAASGPRGSTLPAGVKLGKYYALVIGNDSYAAFPELTSAGSDAKAVAGVLQSRYGYDVRALANANRFEMLSALNDLREKLTEQDNLLVYFAGHGEIDAARQGYWLPVDAQIGQSSSWISNRAISDILTTVQAKHVLVIADSCYSGTMTRSSLATFGGGMQDNVWGDWVKTMVAGRSRTALTSGGVQPVADASNKGAHSVFAAALLTVLSDNNQLLTGQQLFREIAAGMALRSANAGLKQAPEYAPIQFAGHEAGEFFLMPGKA
jgi:Caspase domain/Sel1 repeat